MSLSAETVKYVADLARIELGPADLEKLSRQLQEIVSFIDTLKAVNVEAIEPTSHILPLENVFRNDLPGRSLDTEKALANAPQRNAHFFVVPIVIEQ